VSSVINEVAEPRTRALIEQLRKLIETNGYRKSEIARALGVHPRKVDRWLSRSYGKRPSVEDALALADLVGRMKRRTQRQASEGSCDRKLRNSSSLKSPFA
jgi:transcriptional regulator with XRE-family HTH domain